jgi:hypothetical protein
MNFIKQNISLIIGISIPILMIVLVTASIYLPGIFVQPQTNFLYYSKSWKIANSIDYQVKNGKIVETISYSDNSKDTNAAFKPTIFLHDVVENKSKEISYQDAHKLNLDTSNESPDGFEVVYGSSNDGFLFFGPGRDYSTRYLQNNNFSKKLNLKLDNNSHSAFTFIGWIK